MIKDKQPCSNATQLNSFQQPPMGIGRADIRFYRVGIAPTAVLTRQAEPAHGSRRPSYRRADVCARTSYRPLSDVEFRKC